MPKRKAVDDELPEPESLPAPPYTVCKSGSQFLMWDAKEVYALHCTYRLVGNFLGSIQGYYAQANVLSLPLSLAEEEVAIGMHAGILKVVDSHGETLNVELSSDADSLARRAVFEDLWNRGYYLTSGTKFGCDFLAYAGDPLYQHASFLVFVVQADALLAMRELNTFTRLALTVKKTALVASASSVADGTAHGASVSYTSLQWNNWNEVEPLASATEVKTEIQLENEEGCG